MKRRKNAGSAFRGRALSLALALAVGLLAAWPAAGSEDIVREITGNGTLGSDYLPRRQEYRLDPTSDFHYTSDPFLRDKKKQEVRAKQKESPVSLSIGKDQRADPVTGDTARADRGGSDADLLDAVGGKVQVDVKVLEF